MKTNLRITISKDRTHWYIILFDLVFLLFSINDLMTSAQTGNKETDRQAAHIYLLCVTGFLLLYALFRLRRICLQKPLTNLILLTLWIWFVNSIRDVSTWGVLVQGNMSVLWVLSYLFFEDVRKNSKDNKAIKRLIIAMLLFYAGATVYYFFDIMVRLGRIPVLNVIYNVLALLPWVVVGQKKKAMVWTFVIASALTLLSMKRGAILALVLMILVPFLVKSIQEKKPRHLAKPLLVLALFGIAFLAANSLTDGFLFLRFSSEELASGSGRTEQYSFVFSELSKANWSQWIFGAGCEKSVSVLGTGIHNEWLNFLYSYGLVGLFLYASMIIGFFQKARSIRRKVPELATPCYLMIALYLVLSLISTGYGGYVGLWLFGFWGFIQEESEQQFKLRSETV